MGSHNESTDSFYLRTFHLKNVSSGEHRELTHLQFTAWPDHGIPDDTMKFLSFVQRKRQIMEDLRIGDSEPIVVHCSAGVGRTGVFCLVEHALSCVEQGLSLNFAMTLNNMRRQRPQLIQSPDQYKFCYSVIRDAISVDAMDYDDEDDDPQSTEM